MARRKSVPIGRPGGVSGIPAHVVPTARRTAAYPASAASTASATSSADMAAQGKPRGSWVEEHATASCFGIEHIFRVSPLKSRPVAEVLKRHGRQADDVHGDAVPG